MSKLIPSILAAPAFAFNGEAIPVHSASNLVNLSSYTFDFLVLYYACSLVLISSSYFSKKQNAPGYILPLWQPLALIIVGIVIDGFLQMAGKIAPSIVSLQDYYGLFQLFIQRTDFVLLSSGIAFVIWGAVRYMRSKSGNDSLKRASKSMIVAGIVFVIIAPIVYYAYQTMGSFFSSNPGIGL